MHCISLREGQHRYPSEDGSDVNMQPFVNYVALALGMASHETVQLEGSIRDSRSCLGPNFKPA